VTPRACYCAAFCRSRNRRLISLHCVPAHFAAGRTYCAPTLRATRQHRRHVPLRRIAKKRPGTQHAAGGERGAWRKQTWRAKRHQRSKEPARSNGGSIYRASAAARKVASEATAVANGVKMAAKKINKQKKISQEHQ